MSSKQRPQRHDDVCDGCMHTALPQRSAFACGKALQCNSMLLCPCAFHFIIMSCLHNSVLTSTLLMQTQHIPMASRASCTCIIVKALA